MRATFITIINSDLHKIWYFWSGNTDQNISLSKELFPREIMNSFRPGSRYVWRFTTFDFENEEQYGGHCKCQSKFDNVKIIFNYEFGHDFELFAFNIQKTGKH